MNQFSITKSLKKAVYEFIKSQDLLQYGNTIEKEVFDLFCAGADQQQYIFFLMQMQDYLKSRGWPCKIVAQQHIKILESSQLSEHTSTWRKNQVRRYKKKEESLSNVHFDQISRDDVNKIMHETMKLSQTLKALKSTLNKYLD